MNRFRNTMNRAALAIGILLAGGLVATGSWLAGQAVADDELAEPTGFTIPVVAVQDEEAMHIIVDREEGQYLGHPTTVLLEDGQTILCVYPKGHGRGGIVYKRSEDGGLTWSDRLETPESWSTSREVPTKRRRSPTDECRSVQS